MEVTSKWTFAKYLGITLPPPKAATPELHSVSPGLAVPPGSTHTAALRRAGERTAAGAPPRRGGSVEIALPGTARLPPPALFLRRCPLFFFPTILNFRIAFWPLAPWKRDDKRACVSSKHNTSQQRRAVAVARRSRRAQNRQRENDAQSSRPQRNRKRDNDARRSRYRQNRERENDTRRSRRQQNRDCQNQARRSQHRQNRQLHNARRRDRVPPSRFFMSALPLEDIFEGEWPRHILSARTECPSCYALLWAGPGKTSYIFTEQPVLLPVVLHCCTRCVLSLLHIRPSVLIICSTSSLQYSTLGTHPPCADRVPFLLRSPLGRST